MNRIPAIVRWLFGNARRYRLHLVLSMSLASLSAILSIVPMLCAYGLARQFFGEEAFSQSWQTTILALGICSIILRCVFYYLAMIFSHICAYGMHYDLRSRIAAHLALLPMGFFDRKSSGGIKKIMGADIEDMEAFIAHYVPDALSALVLPIVTAAVLFSVNAEMAVAALLPLPIAFAMHMGMNRIYRNNVQRFHDNMEDMNGTIVEYVRGMSVIKAFNQTAESFGRYRSALTEHARIAKEWSRGAAGFASCFWGCLDLGVLFVLPPGIWLFSTDQISAAEFLLFMLLSPGLMEPMERIIMISGLLDRIGEGIARVQGILAHPPLPEPENPIRPENHTVEFHNVTFGYTAETNVLRDVSCVLEQGTANAFIGPSGAGKSTAARLIPRFHDICQGRICIGGADIRRISTHDLMAATACVFQDTYLMNDTIMENIRMGNLSASDKQVMRAAENAAAHEFISALEQGYQTMAGEGGAFLSGGEKQRIAIARAFLKDAPILILDEMTSSTDPGNEQHIFRALNTLMRGKTVIIIAHRLPSVMHADRLFLFENGGIRSAGTHSELIDDKLYARLWQSCTQAAKWRLTTTGGEEKPC